MTERSEDSKADRNVQNVEGEGKEVGGNLRQKRDVRMTVGRKGAKGKQEETKTDKDVEAFVSCQRAPHSVGPEFMSNGYMIHQGCKQNLWQYFTATAAGSKSRSKKKAVKTV